MYKNVMGSRVDRGSDATSLSQRPCANVRAGRWGRDYSMA